MFVSECVREIIHKKTCITTMTQLRIPHPRQSRRATSARTCITNLQQFFVAKKGEFCNAKV